MSPTALLILTLLSATTPVADTPPPAKLEFPLAGYRINAFDSSTKEPFYLAMFVPVSGNSFFLKVGIQSLYQTLQNQVKETRSFFTQSGNAILLDRAPSPTEWLFEMTTMGRDKAGPKGHIYQRMIYANGRPYLIEASALDAQWKDVGPKLKACVDSFDPSPDPTPGKVSFPRRGFRFSVLDGAVPVDAKQLLLQTLGLP